jgi:hypothetical protein
MKVGDYRPGLCSQQDFEALSVILELLQVQLSLLFKRKGNDRPLREKPLMVPFITNEILLAFGMEARKRRVLKSEPERRRGIWTSWCGSTVCSTWLSPFTMLTPFK